MAPFDEWIDYVRLINLITCSTCVIILLGGFARHRNHYNVKTRDYWYGRVMWCATGVVISFEGIDKEFPLTIVPLFVFIASIVTLKGMLQKGQWGYSDN